MGRQGPAEGERIVAYGMEVCRTSMFLNKPQAAEATRVADRPAAVGPSQPRGRPGPSGPAAPSGRPDATSAEGRCPLWRPSGPGRSDLRGSSRAAGDGRTPEVKAALITKDEAAGLVAVSARTLDRLVSRGEFPPPIRLGGMRRWNRADLERWIADGCKPVRRA